MFADFAEFSPICENLSLRNFQIYSIREKNSREIFAKKIQIRLNFTFELKSQIILKLFLMIHFFKYRNEQKLKTGMLMLN